MADIKNGQVLSIKVGPMTEGTGYRMLKAGVHHDKPYDHNFVPDTVYDYVDVGPYRIDVDQSGVIHIWKRNCEDHRFGVKDAMFAEFVSGSVETTEQFVEDGV